MKARIPFVIAALAVLGQVGLFYRAILHHTGGVFCYPLDDAFIHLALARHIAFDGINGVTPYAFTSASSSIVWPFALAFLMKVTGNLPLLPLLLNIVLGTVLIWIVTDAFVTETPRASLAARVLCSLLVLILTPLSTLIVTGMEHPLHALATLAFVLEGARVLHSGETRRPTRLALLGMCMVAARYEGLFVLGLAAFLLVLRRQRRSALLVLAAGGLPVVAFGVYSRLHGSLFFPNSVVLKRNHFDFSNASTFVDLLGGNVVDRVAHQPFLLASMTALILLTIDAARNEAAWSKNLMRLVLALGATAAHIELAGIGWFFRYEAYFILLDATVICLAIIERIPNLVDVARDPSRRWIGLASVAGLVLGVAPLAARALDAMASTPLASRNIFQQQVQTARFLEKYFSNDVVAINDIGAVAYYGHEHIVDLMGLASIDVAKAKSLQLEKPLTRADVEHFTRDAPVAVIYDAWFPGGIPRAWVRLGRWRIEEPRSAAFPSVEIYATSGDAVPRVLAALRDFSPSLPALVHQEGRYVELPRVDDEEVLHVDVGDVVDIRLEGADDLSSVAHVQPDGSVYLGKIGEVKARGVTERELESRIRARIEEVKDAQHLPPIARVGARVIERRGFHFYVSGQVERSGDFAQTCAPTVRRAIELAGGIRDKGDASRVYVWREDNSGLRRVPLDSRNGPGDFSLISRDIVVVP